MAEEQGNGTPPTEQNARTAESIQAEFYRKTEKLTEENKAINAKLDAALALIQQQNQQSRQQLAASTSTSLADLSEEQLEELSYKDPKMYAKAVKAQAAQQASQIVDQRINQQNQTQAVMGQLIGDYPELGDTTSDLSKRAVELYNQLPADLRSNPIAYKTAVRDAAAELGVLTKSKRKAANSDDGSFSLGSNSTGSSQRGNQSKKDDVDPRTLEMAERLGLNIKDPKVVDRLKQRSQRKNWGKYE